jgi:dihydroxyacid dehydratase/phosphogluconate dehydratase
MWMRTPCWCCAVEGRRASRDAGSLEHAVAEQLLEQGVRDMVRICDGRMSGTANGTVVLHVAPEAAASGPLALVQAGDEITLDVPRPNVDVGSVEEELLRRRPNAATLAGFANPVRGWEGLYLNHDSRPTRAPTSTSLSGQQEIG